jgi:cytochrome P450 family 6
VSYCLHELAKNPQIQRKAQREVDSLFKPTDDGENMYEVLKSLKYIECCMNETLRKYTPLPVLNRECSKDYKVADSDYTIRRGTPVIIPIFGLHRDPDIYENPLEFKPERFEISPNGSDVDGMFYLPFGEGQRICIGHRMGKQNVKFQLALLLSKFNFELAKFSSSEEIKFNPNQLFLQPIGDINLKLSLRDGR